MSGWVATLDHHGNEIGVIFLDVIDAIDVVEYTPQEMVLITDPEPPAPDVGPIAKMFSTAAGRYGMADTGPKQWQVMVSFGGEVRIVGVFEEPEPAFLALAQLAEHVESIRTGVPLRPELPAEVVNMTLEDLGPKSRVLLRTVAELAGVARSQSNVDGWVRLDEAMATAEVSNAIVDKLVVGGWLIQSWSPEATLEGQVPADLIALGPRVTGARA